MKKFARWRVAFITAVTSERAFRPIQIRLQEACSKVGVQLDLLKNGNFCYSVRQNSSRLFYGGQPVHPEDYNLAIARLAIKAAHGGNYYVLRFFQRHGIPVINSPEALIRAKDKLRTLEMLAESGLPVTPTIVVRTREQIPQALSLIEGPPYIVKHCFGSRGTEVLQANTCAQVTAIFDSLWDLDRHRVLLIQPFLGPNPMSDIRAIYLNYRPWKAVLRVAKNGEFRTNLHMGAVSTPIELTHGEKEICQAAVRIMELQLAGIDFLRTPAGPVLLEVNGCPGMDGIVETYARHGSDLISEFASELVQYLESHIKVIRA